MTPVDIVDYEARYREDFERLNVEWLQRYFHVEPVDRQILKDPGRLVIARGGVILFARRGGEILGTVALKHHGNDEYELTKMAVTDTAQGEGIGRLLLEAALERFERLKGRRLYLESHSSLERALGLYLRAGFEHRAPPAPSEYQRADVYMVYTGGSTEKDLRKGVESAVEATGRRGPSSR